MNVFSQIFDVYEYKCLEYKLTGPRKISVVLIIQVEKADHSRCVLELGERMAWLSQRNGQNHAHTKEAVLSSSLFPDKRGWSDSPPKTLLCFWAKIPCMQPICHRQRIAKKNTSCPLNLDMFKGWDSVGLYRWNGVQQKLLGVWTLSKMS